MAEPETGPRPRTSKFKPEHKKLARLPPNAKVEKRPLLRPAIPSPYAGSNQPKIVYISSHTPFLSAVKRVEKLLNLADKRLVQSAATNAKQSNGSRGKRKRGTEGDEILGIAEEVERLKGQKRRRTEPVSGDGGYGVGTATEEVVLKGTGKAIHRVLELALWFQQREEEYVVRLRTGSVGAIDDISVEEGVGTGKDEGVQGNEDEDAQAGAQDGVAMDVDGGAALQTSDGTSTAQMPNEGDKTGGKKKAKRKRGNTALAPDELPETRIRYASVLEAAVSLR